MDRVQSEGYTDMTQDCGWKETQRWHADFRVETLLSSAACRAPHSPSVRSTVSSAQASGRAGLLLLLHTLSKHLEHSPLSPPWCNPNPNLLHPSVWQQNLLWSYQTWWVPPAVCSPSAGHVPFIRIYCNYSFTSIHEILCCPPTRL